jgi:probable rRNA maturation factor
MVHLEIEAGYPIDDPGQLGRAAQATLEHQGAGEEVDLSIVISGDERLRQLNSQYLGVDAPTDVLSFPGEFTDPETGVPYLGDVVISYPRVRAQAAAGTHSEVDELQLLVVHGTLHLLGHDHAEPEEKERMWAAQKQILQMLGVPIDPAAD